MSKANSGLGSKHQSKVQYSIAGIIGEETGYEVLKEVVIRLKSGDVNPNHIVDIQGKMVTDDEWYRIGVLKGIGTKLFHIASWDYVRFECIVYDCTVPCTLRSSAYFSDGIFLVEAITNMHDDLSLRLDTINDSICKVTEEVEILKLQIELITDHEQDEVK